MKKFLGENKIYFETLGTTIPSLIAVGVALFALFQSNSAIEATHQQTKLSEKQNRPYLTVNIDPKLDKDYRVVDSHVEVKNYGQTARNLKMTVYEFLDIERDLVGKGVWNDLYPIRGYYQFQFLTGEPTGTIAKLYPNGNYEKMGNLYKEALKTDPSTKQGSLAPFFKSLVSIEYETTSDRKVTDYFIASPHGDCYKISELKAETYIEKYTKADRGMEIPWFDQLTVSSLLAACQKAEQGAAANP